MLFHPSRLLLAMLLAPLLASAQMVVLDPGHGGSDPGAIVRGVREKDLTLDLCLRAERILHQMGINTAVTRDRDVTVSLAQRSRLAGYFPGAIFVSVHCNTSPRSTSAGVEGFALSESGRALSDAVLRRMCQRTGLLNRGTRARKLHVVSRNSVPCAMLVEAGFMSNPREFTLLLDPGFREAQALAIAEGIRERLHPSVDALAARSRSGRPESRPLWTPRRYYTHQRRGWSA